MLNQPTHWQIWSVVDGTVDLDYVASTEMDADEMAGTMSLTYRDEGEAYEVFVLAHYCGDGDCNCVQWITDHRPRCSYNPSTAW